MSILRPAQQNVAIDGAAYSPKEAAGLGEREVILTDLTGIKAPTRGAQVNRNDPFGSSHAGPGHTVTNSTPSNSAKVRRSPIRWPVPRAQW